MRTDDEVKEMFLAIGEISSDPTETTPADLAAIPINKWQADSFKYGYLMGRLHTLEWVLGGPSAPVKCDYDFEDYLKEHGIGRIGPP
jgi:hypothetical protein